MKPLQKYIKNIPPQKRKAANAAEKDIQRYLVRLQKECRIDLDVSLKDFVLSRR